MADTTEEYRDFVAEPMEDKPVTALPGIGEELGKKLRTRGFTRASAVLGHYLQMRGELDRFKDWLKNAIHADNHQADLCTRALEEWCKNHI
ncbi:barrier-to-autointegration factor-like protein [Cololabis saira]|uniref:barrier-to-autointegration factor-like protein n=1 Tax=Cololabis saira TaxID=129043 RepID=UPI002AD4A2FC|nr:barrier-to-autointegration factor-like protein [Cololabis saira]